MNTKIIINKDNDITNYYVYEDEKLVEEYSENDESKRLEGNIYLGKVENVKQGMQSAFVNIGREKNGLIHLQDLIPKESDVTGNSLADISQYNINKILKQGDNIIVQIKRDSTDFKGPKLTKDIKLTGKYVVVMPYSKFITASKKIENVNEKNRLLDIAKLIVIENKYSDFGIIIRTLAEGAKKEDIEKDIKEQINKWADILEKSKKKQAPCELYSNKGILGKLITDFSLSNLEIVTNSKEIQDEVIKLNPKAYININKNVIQPNNNNKIWLKCGGYIQIDRTEALIAVDVNSAKYEGKGDMKKTAFNVNKEAAVEIAKQIRLKDLGGIIIIDFIDMDSEDDRNDIKKIFEQSVKEDRAKVQVLEFTKLGLLEVTRKQIFNK